MFITCKPLILASASPRRRQFLTDLGLEFTISPANIDETPLAGEAPINFAQRMAMVKAETIAADNPQAFVIGSDTVVTRAGSILGKPADPTHALTMLRSLQGKTHQVITGLTLVCVQENCKEQLARTTKVTFNTFADPILQAYINTNDPMDKAGSYGIQSKGAFLVRAIEGSCSNVIGMPISACTSLLLHHGVVRPRLHSKAAS